MFRQHMHSYYFRNTSSYIRFEMALNFVFHLVHGRTPLFWTSGNERQQILLNLIRGHVSVIDHLEYMNLYVWRLSRKINRLIKKRWFGILYCSISQHHSSQHSSVCFAELCVKFCLWTKPSSLRKSIHQS